MSGRGRGRGPPAPAAGKQRPTCTWAWSAEPCQRDLPASWGASDPAGTLMPQAQTLCRGKAGARAGGRPVPAWSAARSAARGAPSRRTAPPPTVPGSFPLRGARVGRRTRLSPVPSALCHLLVEAALRSGVGQPSVPLGTSLRLPAACCRLRWLSVAARPAPDVIQAAFQVSPKVLHLPLQLCVFRPQGGLLRLRRFICPTRFSLVWFFS